MYMHNSGHVRTFSCTYNIERPATGASFGLADRSSMSSLDSASVHISSLPTPARNISSRARLSLLNGSAFGACSVGYYAVCSLYLVRQQERASAVAWTPTQAWNTHMTNATVGTRL